MCTVVNLVLVAVNLLLVTGVAMVVAVVAINLVVVTGAVEVVAVVTVNPVVVTGVAMVVAAVAVNPVVVTTAVISNTSAVAVVVIVESCYYQCIVSIISEMLPLLLLVLLCSLFSPCFLLRLQGLDRIDHAKESGPVEFLEWLSLNHSLNFVQQHT